MKKIISILALLLIGISALGQDRSSSGFGLDPSDAEAVARMQARSDSIRQHRPVVALVLSGGGAKGAATVGALKYMEKYNFPIDMVLGTSVGGLLGGFYALGYTPSQLETLIREIDWDMALSDNVPPEVVPYKIRAYKEKYALSFPFYYRYDDRDGSDFTRIREGVMSKSQTAVEDATSVVIKNFLTSLPSGVAYGENVNHIISARTGGYSDSTDFFSFPIPFACVATDLVSGKAKVWHSGDINMAMRSTMSIPGLFAPVRYKDMVLVDGGMRNNFPVDIAREMGADIVIGIELSDVDPVGPDTVHNIADVVTSAIGMLSQDSFERNMKSVDLSIKPDLAGFNMMSFDDVSVEFMLLRGYKAAEQAAPQLDSLRAVIGTEGFSLQGKPAKDISESPAVIKKVQITGLGPKDAEYVRTRLGLRDSTLVNMRLLEDKVADIYGGGSFDFINYELMGTSEPYDLGIHCQKGPIHKFGLGLRVDTEEIVSSLLNLGLNTNALRGPMLDMTAKIGTNPYLDVCGSLITPNLPALNLRAKVSWIDCPRVISNGNTFNIGFFDSFEEFYLSSGPGGNSVVQLGIKNKYQHISKVLGASVMGEYDPSSVNRSFQSIYTLVRQETLDNSYFPERGISAGFRAEAVADLWGKTRKQFFGIFSADVRFPVTLGNFALIPHIDGRFVIGEDIPMVYVNVIGGDMAGRYVEQQIPFMGLNYTAFRRNCIAVSGVDLRLKLGSSHYITATGNVSYDFDTPPTFYEGEFIWGTGLSYAYNTLVGPAKLTIHYSSLTRKVGAYLTVGYNF